MNEVIINAEHAILGRLASYAAKQALRGHDVIIVNCEHALITGNRRDIISTYLNMRQKGGSAMNGPNFPSNPSRIVKRTIRGMLPHRQGRGLAALKRVLCYDRMPREAPKGTAITMHTTTHSPTMTLKELSTEL